MAILVLLCIGLMAQICWGTAGHIFQTQIQSIPLVVLFAYAVIRLPPVERLWIALGAGWLIDLQLGGYLGVHAFVLFVLSFLAPWCQRNLRICRRRLFPVFVFGMSLLIGTVSWFVALPFHKVSVEFGLLFQLQTACLNALWSLILWPLFMGCSQFLTLEEDERPIFLHG